MSTDWPNLGGGSWGAPEALAASTAANVEPTLRDRIELTTALGGDADLGRHLLAFLPDNFEPGELR